jgi:hypothetical protein
LGLFVRVNDIRIFFKPFKEEGAACSGSNFRLNLAMHNYFFVGSTSMTKNLP